MDPATARPRRRRSPPIYDAGAAEAGVVCVSAVVVADQATADAALGDIESGTDFVEVFQRDNLDQSLTRRTAPSPCISAADLEGDAERRSSTSRPPCRPTTHGHRRLLDATGAEAAWVVLVFRPFDELDSVDAEQVTSLIDVTEFDRRRRRLRRPHATARSTPRPARSSSLG